MKHGGNTQRQVSSTTAVQATSDIYVYVYAHITVTWKWLGKGAGHNGHMHALPPHTMTCSNCGLPVNGKRLLGCVLVPEAENPKGVFL